MTRSLTNPAVTDSTGVDRRLSVAPMMDCTDRYFRYLLRLLSRHTLLYTEMVPAAGIVHGDAGRFLGMDPLEHPVAVQFGGSEPDELAYCAQQAASWGFDEINLNVGCPSDRVQSGRFGACLMREPERVAAGVRAAQQETTLPVTVKTRIGVDDCDSFDFLAGFVEHVAEAGCRSLIIHARKAWLQGLSPRQNREVPPLDHERVAAIKSAFPQLEIILNGGVDSLETASQWLGRLDGVMMGREAYGNPYLLAQADQRIFGDNNAPVPSRKQVLTEYLPFVEARRGEGVPLNAMSRHLLGLFQGCPGARAWRRYISENAHRPDAGPEVLEQAATHVREPEFEEPPAEAV